MPRPQMTVHIFALLKRRPDITREQFQEYWGNNHARIFTSLKAVREGVVRYSQFHVLSAPSEVLAAAGLTIAPYDGAAEFWLEKVEDLLTLFGDEEFQKNVTPDEANFLDRNSVQVLVGEDQLKYLKP